MQLIRQLIYLIFALSLVYISAPTLAADKEEKAKEMGLYAMPVLVRQGIDDFGTDFAGLISCLQTILDNAFKDKRTVGWSFTFFDDVKITFPGVSGDVYITLNVIGGKYLLVTEYQFGLETFTDKDVLFSFITTIGRACSNR